MRHMMRIAVLVVVILAVMGHTTRAYAINPRYAGIVVDAKRNLILYEDRADQKRYPASLTKMMTIYLAFEAVESGKITWDTKFTVSPLAARQPQTNISLRTGQKISVRDLTMSLIVRSANDSAVVMAEGLGGSVSNFAKMMTDKAHALGMKDTVYKNPHGLPNNQQVTTARDLVRLAMALRKHFPQNYYMFKANEFKWGGRTYAGHNRVTRYYKGADGLKTGYINASGFNLVTSVRRDGQDLIGVVMGGVTGGSRDAHMMSLMDDALKRLKGGFFQQFASNVPRPTYEKPTAYAQMRLKQAKEEITLADAVDPVFAPVPEETQQQTSDKSSASASAPTSVFAALTPVSYSTDVTAMKQPIFKQAKLVVSNTEETPGQWGVQVGTFKNAQEAMLAAAQAIQIAPNKLSKSSIRVAEYGIGTHTLHRARLTGMSQDVARDACELLKQKETACFVYQETASPSS